MRRLLRVLAAATLAALGIQDEVRATPQFARTYGVSCGKCHSLPPKLNDYGERFLLQGYHAPELASSRTLRIAIWVSSRAERQAVSGAPRDTAGPFWNRVELISAGRPLPRLSYFVEWRVVSRESRPDGTLRDRSGRFEDAFVNLELGAWDLTAGQFRQIAQVDVSRRLSLSEPLPLAASVAGAAGGTARQQSLRAFSPAGRSPAIRLSRTVEPRGPWMWTTSIGVPISGEFSIPLTSDARTEASHEIEWRAKGVVVESFLRRGLTSYGAHLFYDDSERHLAHLVVTGARGPFHWTGAAGYARSRGTVRGRWSVEWEYLPRTDLGFGLRVENQAADAVPGAVLPYVVWQLPGPFHRLLVTLEQRVQRGRNATLLETGVVF